MRLKASLFDVSMSEGFVAGKAIVAGDEWSKCLVVGRR